MDHSSNPAGSAANKETTEGTLWHSGNVGKLVARAEALLRQRLRQWRESNGNLADVPSWIPIAHNFVQAIIDEGARELLVSHPEGPFAAVAEFRAFVDYCLRHLYDDYFWPHMLTCKFEIFEDLECTKPIPITNEDRYDQFANHVFVGSPPLADVLEDAVTNYLESAGQIGNIGTLVRSGVTGQPRAEPAVSTAADRQDFMVQHLAPTPRKPTMNAFSTDADIAQSSFSRWYNGRQRLGKENLGKLAGHLGVEPEKIPN